MHALSVLVLQKDVGFKFEPHVYNKCQNVLMTALKNDDWVKKNCNNECKRYWL